jgi:RPA family protein
VESVDYDSGLLRYVIDDGTGKLVCKKYMDTDPMRGGYGTESKRVETGKYVRVVGPFRRYGNESFLTAHRIEEITNLDEIARHRIEVIHTYLLLTDGLSRGADHNSAAVSSSSSVQYTTHPTGMQESKHFS